MCIDDNSHSCVTCEQRRAACKADCGISMSPDNQHVSPQDGTSDSWRVIRTLGIAVGVFTACQIACKALGVKP